MAVVGPGDVLHVVEHVPGHLPVLVLGGVGQHRPHQHDAHRQEAHCDTEQGPFSFGRRFFDGLHGDHTDGRGGRGRGCSLIVRDGGQLDWVAQVRGYVHQGTRVVLDGIKIFL